MAKIFLSYDREDAQKARSVAQLIERAGNTVWWDRNIKGGSQYSQEIEQALADADAVVVLWSSASINSAWVRDEAAAGRDSGRLVPVLIEAISPPMGFRQYQTVDLSDWSHRRRSKQLKDLTSAIDSTAKVQTDNCPDPGPAAQPQLQATSGKSVPWRYLTVAAFVMVGLGAAYWRWSGRAGSQAQTVVISPADQQSKSLARTLLIQLGSLQSAKSGAIRLVGNESDVASHADLILETAIGSDRGTANLALLGGKDRDLLWSKDFSQNGDTQTSLDQRAAIEAANVLNCAVEGLGDKGAGLGQQNLKVYLGACASGDDVGWDKRPVIAAFRQVTNAAPNFSAAWGRLLLAESDALSFLRFQPDAKMSLQADLRRDIVSARKADPNLAEATLAEISFLSPARIAPVMAKIDQAKVQNPNSAPVLAERSFRLGSVGRMEESVAESYQASLADPLSSETRSNYIRSLGYAGQVTKARDELEKALRLWPHAEPMKQAQYALNRRFGDFKKAMAENSEDPRPWVTTYVAMREHPSDSTVKAYTALVLPTIGHPGVATEALQAFAEVRRNDDFFALIARGEALAELQNNTYILFRPWMASVRADPRFMVLTRRLGLIDYWRKSGKWPDFCNEPRLPYNCKGEAAKLL